MKSIKVAVARPVAAFRTRTYLRGRARRADITSARQVLSRAGKGNPPVMGDELPLSLEGRAESGG